MFASKVSLLVEMSQHFPRVIKVLIVGEKRSIMWQHYMPFMTPEMQRNLQRAGLIKMTMRLPERMGVGFSLSLIEGFFGQHLERPVTLTWKQYWTLNVWNKYFDSM